jgi:ABC-type arginine/histidine transport system permease subunit
MKTNQLKLVVLFCILNANKVIASEQANSVSSSNSSYSAEYDLKFFLVVGIIFLVLAVIIVMACRKKPDE